LRSRFWRLPADQTALSDGAEPPAGRMTAYVTAVVFARRVVLVEAGKGSAPSTDFGGFAFENAVDPELLRRLVVEHPIPVEPVEPVAPSGQVAAPRTHLDVVVQPDRQVLVQTGAEALVEAKPVAGLRLDTSVLRLAGGNAVIGGGASLSASVGTRPALRSSAMKRPAAALVSSAQLTLNPAIAASLRRKAFTRLPDIDLGTQPAAVAQPAPDPNTVYVLAFICKPIGRSPDPDPVLTWD
ncbi:MAG: hypothetical protein QM622_01955, partial [Microbacterium sp.]